MVPMVRTDEECVRLAGVTLLIIARVSILMEKHILLLSLKEHHGAQSSNSHS